MLTIPPRLKYRAKNRLHTWCNCWKVERTDGVILRVTDLETKLTVKFADVGNKVFTPLGGFNASARQRELGLQEQNLDITGAITADSVNFDDLRSGLYREAEVHEYLVDWLCPFAGPIRTVRYWIVRTEFDSEVWKADIEGLTRWLRQARGTLYTRNCRWFLGRDDDGVLSSISGRGCRYDVVSATEYNLEVNTVTTQRLAFQIVTSLSDATGWFDRGRLIWVSGANAGVETAVRTYTNPKTFELMMPTPHDIAAGDHFHVEPGCDGRWSTCEDKFSNGDNHGGFPDMPGNDAAMRVPKNKGQ